MAENALRHAVGACAGILAVFVMYWFFFSNIDVAEPLEQDGLLPSYEAIPLENRLALLKVAARRAFDRDLDIKLGYRFLELCNKYKEIEMRLVGVGGALQIGMLSGEDHQYLRTIQGRSIGMDLSDWCQISQDSPNWLFLLTSSNEVRSEFERLDLRHEFVAAPDRRLIGRKPD